MSRGPGEVRVAAVDLGATSGRVMVATVEVARDGAGSAGSAGSAGRDRLELEEVHRFPNAAVQVGDGLFWDVLGIYREVLRGLRRAGAGGRLDAIGIDSWAVDHGLLDRDGRLLGNPFSHRDGRTAGVAARVAEQVPPAEQYAVNGLAALPFNTVYQLVAAHGTVALESAETLLLLPDLLAYWLTGRRGAERTNASTTGLLDVVEGDWSTDLAQRLGVPWRILPPLREPGETLGTLLPDVAVALGAAPDLPVVAVGSHDTASAVVAVPAGDGSGDVAYLSSGTWSLLGLELDAPVLGEEARVAGFTNEVGVDDTIRFLRNVMGLWVLSESVRAWADAGLEGADLATLLEAAADTTQVAPLRTVVDIDDPRLLPPGDLPARIRAIAAEVGEPEPRTPVEVTRTILDSLALAYRRTLREAARLTGRQPAVLHVVGGGTRNALLCALTADACGLPVVAGPGEAAALGNVLVQARALGVDLPDLSAMRPGGRPAPGRARWPGGPRGSRPGRRRRRWCRRPRRCRWQRSRRSRRGRGPRRAGRSRHRPRRRPPLPRLASAPPSGTRTGPAGRRRPRPRRHRSHRARPPRRH